MPGLLNSSTTAISIDFSDITAGHTFNISGLQFLPSAEGGRKLRGLIQVDAGGGTPITCILTVTLRDLVYDEFGLFGNQLDANSRKKLVTKY